VLESHPADIKSFREIIASSGHILDQQQLGSRFHLVVEDMAAADDFIKKAGKDSMTHVIAASVEDVFIERIKE
jgi:hypothetical protein